LEPSLRDIVSVDWITILLLSSLVLISVARYFFPKRFEEFLLLPLTDKYFLVKGRADQIQHPFNMLLFINQVIAVSLFLMVFITKYSPGIIEPGWMSFLQIGAIYGSFILAKVLIEKIIAATFRFEPMMNQYLYEKLTYRNLIGVLLWIVNLVIYYIWSPGFYVLLGCIVLIVILNGVTLFYSYKSIEHTIFRNFFYFILYLCALEISPYVILFKVFVV